MKRLLLVFCFLLGVCFNSQAATFTDLKFGRYQIADSQWNVQACMYSTTCQIYSKNPGTAYKIPWTSGQIQWATGDYIGFVTNAHNDANNPFTLASIATTGGGISISATTPTATP